MNASKANPDISIVLPTYNVGKYIDRCLESCVKQTHYNIEIVVVDDCGTDDSIDRARQWASNDSRIKIISNTRNLGTYHARRCGVENSDGQYIIFLDPDDSLDHQAAREIFDVSQAESPDIIFFGTTQFFPRSVGKIKVRTKNSMVLSGDLMKDFSLKKPSDLGTAGKAYLKSTLIDAFSSAGVSHEERLVFGEDTLILFLVLIRSVNGVSIRKSLYNYYINPNSITFQKSIADVRLQQDQIEKVLFYLDEYFRCRKEVFGKTSLAVLEHFKSKLRSDKHMLARHTLDEYLNDQYFKSITLAFLELRTLKDLARISVYIATMGKVRL